MKLLKLFLMVFRILLIFLVISFTKGESSDAVGNANEYIDEVLENLRNEEWIKSQLDPLVIPDVHEKNFAVTEGKIKGLSSLYRHGDCTLDYVDEVVKVSAEVAVRDVVVETRYAAKALFFWIKGHATVTVSDLAVKMDISGKDGKAKLESFKVTNLGNYKVTKITGMSVILNWLLKLIVNAVAKKSRGKIIDALENGVSSAVGDLLEKYQLPNLSGPVPGA